MRLSSPYTKLALVLIILFWRGFIHSPSTIMVRLWVVYPIEHLERIEHKAPPPPGADTD